jgi:exodeoxyribonuclease V alpha subunit
MWYTPSQLQQAGALSALDTHFARFLRRQDNTENPALELGAALVSQWIGRGHICLELPQLAGKPLALEELAELDGMCPALDAWRDDLRRSTVVGKPGEVKPLILDQRDCLYLYRYWDYEQRLANWLRCRPKPPSVDAEALAAGIARLFPHERDSDQRDAALTAMQHSFSVISGGPGTGKTTTVVKVLALLLEQRADLRIQIAAPTGKAAARLQESISVQRDGLACDAAIQARLPEQATTLHRLLGVKTGSAYFRHHPGNPLVLDVLVIDEASMVDLALMTKTVEALPPHARLILLGDHEQLASVEAGAVLGDICAAAVNSPLHGQIRFLRHSHRFHSDSGIGQLAALVNAGDSVGALACLSHIQSPIRWQAENDLRKQQNLIVQGFQSYLRAPDIMTALQAFNRFRVLCAHRHGLFGVSELNRHIETMLQKAGLLQAQGNWYHGRPILITENDYNLNVFNGDTGLLWHDERGRLRAYFLASDGTARSILPARLPAHDTVFAMTIHKSQGSEFDDVLLVLPDKPSLVLSRELLYTGLTRAKQHLTLLARQEIVEYAVQTRSLRGSGLREALNTQQAASAPVPEPVEGRCGNLT